MRDSRSFRKNARLLFNLSTSSTSWERQRQSERERDRETDRQTDRQRERERETETERDRDRQRERERDRERQRERERERERDRKQETDRQMEGNEQEREYIWLDKREEMISKEKQTLRLSVHLTMMDTKNHHILGEKKATFLLMKLQNNGQSLLCPFKTKGLQAINVLYFS